MRKRLLIVNGRTEDIRLVKENKERYTKLIIHNYEELVEAKAQIGFRWLLLGHGETDMDIIRHNYHLKEKYQILFFKSTIEPDIELI